MDSESGANADIDATFVLRDAKPDAAPGAEPGANPGADLAAESESPSASDSGAEKSASVFQNSFAPECSDFDLA